jgi:2-methylisocitrate lyase-like PEP mutase family enzyme
VGRHTETHTQDVSSYETISFHFENILKSESVSGFPGIWGSGLAISAQLGVRDSNEASWTQVLEVVEFMADATDIPILLDADTGYGNFNNARRLVRKLEDRGIAGKQLTKLSLFSLHR